MPPRALGRLVPALLSAALMGLSELPLLRNEPPALARSRKSSIYESHPACFSLISDPEVFKTNLTQRQTFTFKASWKRKGWPLQDVFFLFRKAEREVGRLQQERSYVVSGVCGAVIFQDVSLWYLAW